MITLVQLSSVNFIKEYGYNFETIDPYRKKAAILKPIIATFSKLKYIIHNKV